MTAAICTASFHANVVMCIHLNQVLMVSFMSRSAGAGGGLKPRAARALLLPGLPDRGGAAAGGGAWAGLLRGAARRASGQDLPPPVLAE